MKRGLTREGDIYDIVCIGGHSFTICYGYYDAAEREVTDPVPIYPCFVTNPKYTHDGYPLVTRVQDACEYYTCAENQEGDGWCADCIHCSTEHEEIGICRCPHRKNSPPGHTPAASFTPDPDPYIS